VEPRTFRPGVLGEHESVKGFALAATDGSAGRISWGSYAPGESYLVVTTGVIRRKHRVLPAGAVTSVRDGEVHVSMSRSEIATLPEVPHPEAAVDDETAEHMLNAFKRAASYPQDGGF
jgi:hypothetical protein